MLNLTPLAGTAVRIARVARRNLLLTILLAAAFFANSILHTVVEPVCKAVVLTAGPWLPVLIAAAAVIVLVLERTRNLKF